jgi:hypothetical protein
VFDFSHKSLNRAFQLTVRTIVGGFFPGRARKVACVHMCPVANFTKLITCNVQRDEQVKAANVIRRERPYV